MAKLGIYVTLVLDCCFAGSVLRGDDWNGAGIRFIEYHNAFDTGPDYDLFAPGLVSVSTTRSSKVKLSHLLDPKTYTILSACSPDKKSWEIKFKGGIRRRALSYFLINLLVALGRRQA
jgi:hypothetical protein